MAMAWFSVWGKEKNQVPYGTFLGFHVESHMEPLHMGYNTRWCECDSELRPDCSKVVPVEKMCFLPIELALLRNIKN